VNKNAAAVISVKNVAAVISVKNAAAVISDVVEAKATIIFSAATFDVVKAKATVNAAAAAVVVAYATTQDVTSTFRYTTFTCFRHRRR
jgi:hypothetical protein